MEMEQLPWHSRKRETASLFNNRLDIRAIWIKEETGGEKIQ
jgi:hypothetical protein